MTRIILIALAATVAAAFTTAAVAPVSAHHSHAMFDGSKETEITGALAAVRFANPHVYSQVRATHRDGVALDPVQTWAIEMSTTQNQTSRGLTPNVLKGGAPISVKVNPLFSGGASGNYTNVVMLDGVMNTSKGQEWVPPAASASAR